MSWKSVERQLAKRMNGERVPVSGRTGARGQESPDIAHDEFAIEVKTRQRAKPGRSATVPLWIGYALDQAEKSRLPHHKAAIVIIHEKGRAHDNDLVFMSLADFERITSED